ncbi:MAG TPA: S9 family peptidase [Candidatus Dormibacteraeota bacterium]|nr:S9 family peptidase [Candidatus Dormibacteraeota bacterium]
MRLSLASLMCACLCVAAPAIASARAFTLDDYATIVSVGDPQISPDGRRIVVVVGHVDAQKDRTLTELVLVDTATGAHRIITHGRDGVGAPRWSPDGTSISFVAASGSGSDATAQVWVMPMEGGDARVVTKAKYGVDVYAWRPDGRAIAYVTQDAPPNQAALEHHDDLFTVENLPFSAHGPPVSLHLWLQTLSGGNPTRLTQGPWSIYPDTLSWSADGKYVAFDRLPDGRFDSIFRSRVAVLDVATRHIAFPDNRWSWMASFASSGDRIAYSAGSRGTTLIQNDLSVYSMSAHHVRNAAPALDRNVSFFAWLPDGGLLVSADDHVSTALWRVSPAGAAHRVELGDLNFDGGSVSRDGGVAFIADSARHPSELYYLAPGSDTARRLTDYNAAIATLDLAPARELTWRNGGFDEDGVLTAPLGYERGKTYPLVLVIHGGPVFGASTTAFNPLVQLLAARGFFVLQPNYRGSDNLGYAYAHSIIGVNPIAGVGTDVVAGVKALEATGEIDASRIGVSGWSAGGWTTSWLIAHYDLWKAAVSGAAVNDAVMQYSLSQIDSLMPMLFGGLTPWASPGGMQAYRNASPIADVADVHAATLILSDTTDPRVPTPQAYEFYTALRDLGKTVRFMAVPAYGHHPSDPVRNREIDRVWVDWMVQYLSAH